VLERIPVLIAKRYEPSSVNSCRMSLYHRRRKGVLTYVFRYSFNYFATTTGKALHRNGVFIANEQIECCRQLRSCDQTFELNQLFAPQAP